eukprot:1160198-Pelagomonas_calceolata.AAC.4
MAFAHLSSSNARNSNCAAPDTAVSFPTLLSILKHVNAECLRQANTENSHQKVPLKRREAASDNLCTSDTL